MDEIGRLLDTDGNVVNGNWNDDRAYVNYYSQSNSNPNIRARQVVSTKAPIRSFCFHEAHS